LLAALEIGDRALASMLGAGQSRQTDRRISPREREVLTLVVAGRSNKEIAETSSAKGAVRHKVDASSAPMTVG